MKHAFFDRFSKKCSSIKFHKIRPLVRELFHRTGRRTDRRDERKSWVNTEFLQ